MIMNGLSQGGGSDSRVPVIYTTSYVGTGTSGQNNPTSLTFDFIPSFIWIALGDGTVYENGNSGIGYSTLTQSSVYVGMPIIFCDNLTTSYKETFMYCSYYFETQKNIYAKKTSDGKTISWYITNSDGSIQASNVQYNYSNTTYHVLAIGYKEES